MDSNHRRLAPAELQSAPFGHSGNCPIAVLICVAKALLTLERDEWHHKLSANVRTILETPKLSGNFLFKKCVPRV